MGLNFGGCGTSKVNIVVLYGSKGKEHIANDSFEGENAAYVGRQLRSKFWLIKLSSVNLHVAFVCCFCWSFSPILFANINPGNSESDSSLRRKKGVGNEI